MKNTLHFHGFALAVAAFAEAALAAATPPLVAVDFSSVDDGVAESARRNFSIHIDEGARVLPGGPTGKPFLEFDGSASTVRVDASRVAGACKGDEFAVSMWVRYDREVKVEKNDKRSIAFGLAPVNPFLTDPPIRLSLAKKRSDFGDGQVGNAFEGDFQTGTWHHVAYVYSLSNLVFKSWLDGLPQVRSAIGDDEPVPLESPLKAAMGEHFAGAIADLRAWNVCPGEDDLLRFQPPQAACEAMAADFKAAAEKAPGMTAFAAWCGAMSAKAAACAGKAVAVRDWQDLARQRAWLDRLAHFAAESEKAGGRFAASPFVPVGIDPYAYNKHLPHTMPADARPISSLALAATPGEVEGASLMFFPLGGVGGLHAAPTALTGPGGATIPASAFDLKTVKCWFQTRNGWNSYGAGSASRVDPTLTPELLLHDDSLLKVDCDNRDNYLRVAYPAGERYVNISKKGTPDQVELFYYKVEPVADAPELRPFDLDDGRLKQLWITVHVPAGAAPGDYTGRLDFTVEGKPAGSLPLALKVHPFKLPRPATRYNIDREFTGGFYSFASLEQEFRRYVNECKVPVGSLSNAVRRTFGAYRNMVDHNQFHTFIYAGAPGEYDNDLGDLSLDLYEAAGCATDMVFVSESIVSACDGEWCSGMQRNITDYPNRDISVEANPEKFAQCKASYERDVTRLMDGMRKRFGNPQVYLYGIDEAGPATVRREMPFFALAMKHGAFPVISMCTAKWCAYMIYSENVPASYGHSHARNWHQGGSRCTTYAAPFTGPENPTLWRRNKGILLYMSDFDGAFEYHWSNGAWNEFIDGGTYRTFALTYPTSDGCIDTIAWEADREAFDDVRYLTLLRRLAREAIRSGDAAKVRLGRRAYAWAELIDPCRADLDGMRAKSVEWINRLRATLPESKEVL